MTSKFGDITGADYEVLYARYLDPVKLSKFGGLAGSLIGKTVIDLCAGRGRLSTWCLGQGAAEVIAVDNSVAMVGDLPFDEKTGHGRLSVLVADVYNALRKMQPSSAEVVFCLQSINYWFSCMAVEKVARVLTPGGLFIFNTFWNKPSSLPSVRTYDLDEARYVEVSWCVGNTVCHTQICSGMRPHYNEFSWVTPENYDAVLKGHFQEVSEVKNGPSVTYICKKGG